MNANAKTLDRARLWVLAGAVVALLNASAADAAEADDPAAAHYRQGYNLVLDEDWQAAVAAFDDLLARHSASEWADDAAFWRCYALQRLGRPAAEVFDCYDKILARHPDSEWTDDVRRAMVRLARQLDREGRPEYRDKVRDFGAGEDADRLLAILVALGEIGDERSVDVIFQRLDSTADEHLRARIVEVLDDVASPRVAAKLEELARRDPSPRVRIAAIEVLGDHNAIDPLPLLREILADESQPQRVRREALDAIADRRPPDLIPLLEKLALGADNALALEAIDEIGDLEGEAVLTTLTALLARAPDLRRRLEIVDSIADLEGPGAVAALAETARRDPDPRVRRAAAEELGDINTPAAREALIQLLQEIDD